MAKADIASGKGNNAACYPLVPYSNRIANGHLEFDGKEIVLAPNFPGVRHPMHGDGWAATWQVALSSPTSAELVYEHDARSGWPFRYRARQSFALDEGALSVTFTLENLQPHDVPGGIGLHPFFVRESDTELSCRTQFVWRGDAEVLPVERTLVPPEWDFRSPRRVEEVRLDNCFDGWDGRASIVWPARRLRLDLEASPVFRHLVIFVPPERPLFCVEPVSHANGQLAHTRLAARATLEGKIVFRVRDL